MNKLAIVLSIYFAVTGISACEIDHGRVQVLQIIKSRPVSSSIKNIDGNLIVVDPEIGPWIEISKMFNQEVMGSKVIWDNSEIPTKEKDYLQYRSAFLPPSANNLVRILVREEWLENGRLMPIDFENFWSSIVYELFNARSSDRCLAIRTDALNGWMPKVEFVRRNAELEYEADLALRLFYNEHWKPWAVENGLKTDVFTWGTSARTTYEQWFKAMRKNNYYRYFDKRYDEVWVPYWNKNQKLPLPDYGLGEGVPDP